MFPEEAPYDLHPGRRLISVHLDDKLKERKLVLTNDEGCKKSPPPFRLPHL